MPALGRGLGKSLPFTVKQGHDLASHGDPL